MEALCAHPLLLVNLSLITMWRRLQHMCGVREIAGSEYEQSEGVAGLQQLRLLLCMAQRHFVIFSSTILSSFPLHGTSASQIILSTKPHLLYMVYTPGAS
ncbi:hypothetical protein ACFX2G_035253 [Malus domestica]